jgi:hypothetical protein
MIKNWKVRNFKAITEADVKFSNLNIIVGKNSIGKSSFIQSILALGQYFTEQMPNSRVSFIGNTLDLGPAKTVINRQAVYRDIAFQVTWGNSEDSSTDVRAGMSLSTEKNTPDFMQVDQVLLSPKFLGLGLNGSLTCNVIRRRTLHYMAYEIVFDDGFKVQLGHSKQGKSSGPEIPLPNQTSFEQAISEGPYWLMEILPFLSRTGSLLDKGAFRYNPTKPAADLGRLLSEAHMMSKFANKRAKAFAFIDAKERELLRNSPKSIDNAFAALLEINKRIKSDKQDISPRDRQRDLEGSSKITQEEKRKQLIYARVALAFLLSLGDEGMREEFPEFRWLKEHVESTRQDLMYSSVALALQGQQYLFRSKLKYLGPIRTVQPGDQKNGQSSSTILTLGRSGEYMASFIHANGTRISKFPFPSGKSVTTSLGKALDAWVHYFELGLKTKTQSSEWGATDFTLDGERTSQKGTGVSQVLPVLLACLATEPDSTVLIEQPELHLHPAHQRKLADFFVAIANSGVQLVLETHSEYLITRLRLLVAQAKLSPDKLNIIFSENRQKKGRSTLTFKESRTDANGKLDYWPKGFFEDALVDRILLSTLQYAAELNKDS